MYCCRFGPGTRSTHLRPSGREDELSRLCYPARLESLPRARADAVLNRSQIYATWRLPAWLASVRSGAQGSF